jgi:acyl-CoA thioesterase I
MAKTEAAGRLAIGAIGTGRAIRGALLLASLAAGPGVGVPAEAKPVRLLALGDSLTAGYGLAEKDSFPVRLQARLAADGIAAEIVNAGVSGDTTAGGLARLDWALADKPDVVLVELGANDMLRGIDPKTSYANLDRILARVETRGARPLLFGMLSVGNWGRDYQKQFDAIYPDLAAKYRIPLYPFFLDGVALKPDLIQADGLHPNAAGVAVLVDRIAPFVEKQLAAAPAAGAGADKPGPSDSSGGKGAAP